MFNLMFKTFMGPVEEQAAVVYLRPETAQGIYVNYLNVLQSSRQRIPFGIAQIGKAFRNEITPGNFIFRTREFEQMEMEFFVKPGEDEEWHQRWIDTRTDWYVDLGIDRANLRHYEHPKEKLSHYSKRTVDLEYNYASVGWSELEGIANRTDFDLKQHAAYSGETLEYFDQAAGERYVPYVIEPAAGLSRSLMTFLVDAYSEDEAPNTKGGVDKRTVLRLDPRLAPVKVAVLPLSRNADLTPKAKDVAAELRRAVKELGMCGAMLPSTGIQSNLGDQRYWPIYEEAERLGCAPDHPASGVTRSRIGVEDRLEDEPGAARGFRRVFCRLDRLGPPGRLLRGHVAGRADDRAVLRQAGGVDERACDAVDALVQLVDERPLVVGLHDLESDAPWISFESGGETVRLLTKPNRPGETGGFSGRRFAGFGPPLCFNRVDDNFAGRGARTGGQAGGKHVEGPGRIKVWVQQRGGRFMLGRCLRPAW